MAEIFLKINTDTAQTVQSISSLENELKDLKDRIKDVAIGSEEFKKLQTEIVAVDTKIKNVNKSIEGVDTEKLVGEIGKFAGGMTQAFAGISLVVGKGNKSVEELQKNLNNAIGIVMGVKGAMDAYTSSVNLAKSAQMALNSAVLANPWVILAAAIAAATAALVIYYTTYTEEEEKRIKQIHDSYNELMDYNKMEANRANEIQNTTAKLSNYIKIANDASLKDGTRIEALKNIKEQTKGVINVTDLSAKSLKKLNDESKDYMKTLELQLELELMYADAKVLSQKIVDLQTMTIEEIKEKYGNSTWFGDFWDMMTGTDTIENAKRKQQEQIDLLTTQLDNLKGSIKTTQITLLNYQRGQKKATDDNTRATDKNTKTLSYSELVIKAQFHLRKSLRDILSETNDLLSQQNDELEKLSKTYNKAIVDDLNTTINAAEESSILFSTIESELLDNTKFKKQLDERYKLGQISLDEYLNALQEKEKEISKTTKDYILKSIDDIQQLFSSENFGFIDENLTNAFQVAFDNIRESILVFDNDTSKTLDKVISALKGVAAVAQSIMTIMFEEFQSSQEEQLDNLSRSYDEASDKYAKMLEEQRISQEEYDNIMSDMEKEKAASEKKIKHDAFEKERTAAIINATIQGIVGAVAQFSAGPIVGPILSALVGVLAAAQIAIIASQKNPYATGGLVGQREGLIKGPGTGTSDSIKADVSAGEYIVNAKSTKAFLPVLEMMNSYGKNMTPGVIQQPSLSSVMAKTIYLNSQNDKLIRAYVVASDIKQANSSIDRAVRRSSLG